jgi:hypothetical protein
MEDGRLESREKGEERLAAAAVGLGLPLVTCLGPLLPGTPRLHLRTWT